MIAVVALLPLVVGGVLGGFLVWPVARRIGERDPDRLYWVPVSDPQNTGRRWVPVQPRPARVSLRARAAVGWAQFWAATAPRDVHAPVRRAMSRPGRRPVWMDLPYDFIGQPSEGGVTNA